jgi:hypothetical protein
MLWKINSIIKFISIVGMHKIKSTMHETNHIKFAPCIFRNKRNKVREKCGTQPTGYFTALRG